MHQFSYLMPFDFIDPSRKQSIGDLNIIDPSIRSTVERMADFNLQLKNSLPANKAVEKFGMKIRSLPKFECPRDAISLSTSLTKKGPQAYPSDHTTYYFQQLIPKIEFDFTPTPPNKKRIAIKLPGNSTFELQGRTGKTNYSGPIDNVDVRLIARTDRDADLFMLKMFEQYKCSDGAQPKTPEQLSDIYQLWDTYSPVVSEIINYPKRQLNESRPTDPEYLDVPPTKSYPGGHATAAAALATLLLVTSGLPEDELDALCKTLGQAATYIATMREMAGIHFQEDSNAGLLLGFTVMQGLLNATINSTQTSDLARLLQAACNGRK